MTYIRSQPHNKHTGVLSLPRAFRRFIALTYRPRIVAEISAENLVWLAEFMYKMTCIIRGKQDFRG